MERRQKPQLEEKKQKQTNKIGNAERSGCLGLSEPGYPDEPMAPKSQAKSQSRPVKPQHQDH